MELESETDKLEFVNNLVLDGYTCQQVIKAVFSWAISQDGLSQICQARIVKLISDTEKSIFEGGRDDLNLLLFFEKLKINLERRF